MGQDPFARDKEYKCPLGIIIERGLAYLVEVFAIMNINANISVVCDPCLHHQRSNKLLWITPSFFLLLIKITRRDRGRR